MWWRDHWPRATALMREAEGWKDGRSTPSSRPSVHPTALADISPLLQRMVIIGEDSRFRTHHGIDPTEIADALGMNDVRGVRSAVDALRRHRDRLRGASTITQQLAKNLYLSSSRSALRKVKEAVTALRLELALSKDRILELYLSAAEWGPGIWGVDAASRAYFGVSPSRVTVEQAAELAATLPHPRTSNPTFRPERTLARRDLILAKYRGVDVSIPAEEETDSLPLLQPEMPPLPVDSLEDSLTTRRTDAQGRTADSGRDSLP
jgi:monofunctional biosynthetic peptidoglycan transglycosylase